MPTEKTSKPNYAVLEISKDGSKSVACKFYAENEDEAIKFLEDNYSNSQSSEHQYMYTSVWYCDVLDAEGNSHEEEHIRGIYEHHGPDESFLEKTKDFFIYDVFGKLKRIWWWITDLVFLNKNKIEKSAFWSFDTYILEMIIKVVPYLAENSHGIAEVFITEAMDELKKTDPNDRASQEVMDKAVEIMKKHYNELVLHVKLYDYYCNHGSCTFEFDGKAEFEEQHKSALPIKPNSYMMFDYVKLNELVNAEWDAIWDWMKKYGQTLYD